MSSGNAEAKSILLHALIELICQFANYTDEFVWCWALTCLSRVCWLTMVHSALADAFIDHEWIRLDARTSFNYLARSRILSLILSDSRRTRRGKRAVRQGRIDGIRNRVARGTDSTSSIGAPRATNSISTNQETERSYWFYLTARLHSRSFPHSTLCHHQFFYNTLHIPQNFVNVIIASEACNHHYCKLPCQF